MAAVKRPSGIPQPNPAPSPAPPTWPHCAAGPSAEAPFGCLGVLVAGRACLAHLPDSDRDAYLAGLTPGADVDHRGTSFTQPLFDALLSAVRDPTTAQPHLGKARFDAATFSGDAGFESATFEGEVGFESATFEGGAMFGSATFKSDANFVAANFKAGAMFGSANFEGDVAFGTAIFKSIAEFKSATFGARAGFDETTFQDTAEFSLASFEGSALFNSATFKSPAEFGAAIFKKDASFSLATFEGHGWFMSATFGSEIAFDGATFEEVVQFDGVTFESDVGFSFATFEKAAVLGPFVCTGRVRLSGAMFGGPVTLSIATQRLECRRTRWSATAEIHLRYATVDFAHAVFECPLTIAAEPDPFVLSDGGQLAETAFPAATNPAVRLASLRGVDAAHLVLANVDLSSCLFVGTVHLDQLRLEGACSFDTTPSSARRRGWPPVRFTERRVLAEEHHWRASQPGAVRGWNPAVLGAGRTGPLQLAPVYRALRKGFEDGKHEPGASDFYYGEMEMRRHAGDIPRSERNLLTAYWALSGYGLRASRALAWLGAAMLLTILLLMAVGLPRGDPKQTATGTVPAGGGKVTFEIDKDDPRNPAGNRFTGERFEKALNVTLNSVVFRSADQDLTTTGTYIEMTSRITEPVLLGLAVLAVRNRVKR
ncbi:pentapeptide repeat-containing protein [Streptomyces sp. NPDC004324]